MAAPVGKMDRQAWQLLFETMPIGAMLRNLGSLTSLEVLRVNSIDNCDRVEAVLNDRDYLRKGRIHPINVLKALKTYSSAGKFGRSKKTWTSVPRIIDILEKALELSFEKEYHRKVNPDAKAVYVTLTPYNITLVDPQDNNSWDLAGFDPATPRLIQMLASGEV